MVQFVRNGGIQVETKSSRRSSFVFDPVQEIEITYENYFSNIDYEKVIDGITTIKFVFDTQVFDTGMRFNPIFRKMDYDLDHFNYLTYDKSTSMVSSKYITQIYERMVDIKEKIGYDEAIKVIQNQMSYGTSNKAPDYHSRQNIIKDVVDVVVNQTQEITHTKDTSYILFKDAVSKAYDDLMTYGYEVHEATIILAERLLFAPDIKSFQTAIYNDIYDSKGTGNIITQAREIVEFINMAEIQTNYTYKNPTVDPLTKDSFYLDYTWRNPLVDPTTRDAQYLDMNYRVPLIDPSTRDAQYLDMNWRNPTVDPTTKDAQFIEWNWRTPTIDPITKDTVFSKWQYITERKISDEMAILELQEHPWRFADEIEKSMDFHKPDDPVIINQYLFNIPPYHPEPPYQQKPNDIVFKLVYDQKPADFVFHVRPQYLSDFDQPLQIRSLYYISLDDHMEYKEMLDWSHVGPDTAYIPETMFMHESQYFPEKKNQYFMRQQGTRTDLPYRTILSEYFRVETPPQRLVTTGYGEFYFITEHEERKVYAHATPFEINVNLSYEGIKIHQIPFTKIESNHPLGGGSQHAGHDVPPIADQGASQFKLTDVINFYKEGTDMPFGAGRHGRCATGTYRYSQTVFSKPVQTEEGVVGVGSLHEFDEVDHNLDGIDENNLGIGQGKGLNFVYEIQQGADRFPEYVEIVGQRLKGFVGENDAFIRKYQYEDWVTRNNHPIDDDYTDFNPAEVSTYFSTVIGRNTTRMEIDVLTPNGEELLIGQQLYQYDDAGNIVAQGKITAKMLTYTKPIRTALGEVESSQLHTRYEIDNVDGIFNTFNVEDSFTTTTSTIFDTATVGAIDTQITTLQELITNNPNDTAENLIRQASIITLQQERADVIFNTSQTIISRNAAPAVFNIFKIFSPGFTEDGLIITDVNEESPRGLIKIVDLVFPVENNWSYDRDRFLFTSQKLPTSFVIDSDSDGTLEVLSREEWIAYNRSIGNFRFNTDFNNAAIDQELINVALSFRNGEIGEEERDDRLDKLQDAKGISVENKRTERLEIINAANFIFDNGTDLIPIDERTFYQQPADIIFVPESTVYK